MAVGKAQFPIMHPVKGVKLGVAQAGIKYAERDDLLVIEACEGSAVAATYTQNAFCAAPVKVCREHMAHQPRLLVVNSGNANACTGDQGMADALQSCQLVAKALGASAEQVLPFSTGVIGEHLPMDKFVAAIPQAVANLQEDCWAQAAQAIMTTDTRAKGSSRQLNQEGKTVTITGISKGSGMIKPNMATMLGYIATDASIAQPLLERLEQKAVNLSFNRISVDGDTSTNDSCLLYTSPSPRDKRQSRMPSSA